MSRYNKIIFLDEENTALGPLAQEMLISGLIKNSIFGFRVLSRGNVVLFPEPANQKIVEIAGNQGLDLTSHVASQMTNEDFEEGTLVLALDVNSKKKAYSKYESAANVYTLREYIGEQGDIKFQIGKNIEDYKDTCLLLERSIDILMEKLRDGE